MCSFLDGEPISVIALSHLKEKFLLPMAERTMILRGSPSGIPDGGEEKRCQEAQCLREEKRSNAEARSNSRLKKSLVVRNTTADIQCQVTPATWGEVGNYDQLCFHCGSKADKEEEGLLDKSLDYEF